MRIIELELQAFGPFKYREKIKFDNFGKEGIYLISGVTGSGKTTLFDAISYALFDESSSGERSQNMLRFANSKPDIETYVKLVFEYRANIYEIKRTPDYIRAKKSGLGTTKATKSVEIILPNGDRITGINEAKIYIEELLGVNSEQFRQIVMLAQGKFMRFLKASTKERTDLFRKIFSTEKYENLQKNIEKKMKEKEAIFKELDIRRNENISNFVISDENKFSENKKISDDYLLKYIEEEIAEFQKESKKLEKEINSKSKERDDLNVLKEKIDKNLKIASNISNKESELEKLLPKYKGEKEKHLKLDDDNQKLIELNKKYDKLLEERKKFDFIIEIEEQKNSLEKDLKELKKEIKNIENDIEINSKEILSIDKYLKDTKDIENEKLNLKLSIEKYKSNLKELEEIAVNLEELEILNNEQKQNTRLYEIAKGKYLDIQNEYNYMNDLYFESQAGILARELKENEPCPVCGSINHPSIAKFHDELPDKKKLDKLKKDFEKQRTQKENIKIEISKYKIQIEKLEAQISEKLEKHNLNEDNLIIEISFIKQQLKEKEKREKEIEEIIKIKEEREKAKQKINENIIELEKLKRENNKKTIIFEERIKNLEAQEKKEKEILGDKNLNKINIEISNAEKEIEDLKEYISNTNKEYEKLNEIYKELQGSISALKLTYYENLNINIENIEKEINKIDEILSSFNKRKNELDSKIATNSKHRKILFEIVDKIKNVEKELVDYKELNDLLKGQISGLVKINFETYLQSMYFDQILTAANKRFYDMTDGKYSLRRKTEYIDKVSQVGLDFEIFDYHNRVLRDINTLSGGESFQASLSLALGLSDTIQANAGGIELNSMFVDEGFGTLDNETLSKVMSTLVKISGSNKLIGIISHVEMLKEQIDKQIIIEKTNEGYSKIGNIIY